MAVESKLEHLLNDQLRLKSLASFPGSPEREIYTRGEPGIFAHVSGVMKDVIKFAWA